MVVLVVRVVVHRSPPDDGTVSGTATGGKGGKRVVMVMGSARPVGLAVLEVVRRSVLVPVAV